METQEENLMERSVRLGRRLSGAAGSVMWTGESKEGVVGRCSPNHAADRIIVDWYSLTLSPVVPHHNLPPPSSLASWVGPSVFLSLLSPSPSLCKNVSLLVG